MKHVTSMALKNISRRKKRAALTMLGIFIGIAAVVALVSLGQGVQQTINEQFEKVGVDKIFIQANELSFGGQFAPGQLRIDEVDIVRKAYGVSRATGALFRSGKVEFNRLQRTLFLMSIPDKSDEVDLMNDANTWSAAEGRLLTHKDRGKAVIGNLVAHGNMFLKDIRLGDKIIVESETFEIIGIFAQIGDPGMDRSVVISDEEMRRLLNTPTQESYIIAQSVKGINPDTVAESIKDKLRKHREQKEGKEDFRVETATELIDSFNQVLTMVQVVFIGIAAISLFVGGIGIMNTMYTSVLERTREIGIMKAVGARRQDILSLFLFESGLLGLAGGIIGVVLGGLISKSIEVGANVALGPNTITAIFPIRLIIGTLVFSFVVGTISGVLPAWRASRLQAVDALRYE